MSLRLVPAIVQPTGMPWRSAATGHFQPSSARSVAEPVSVKPPDAGGLAATLQGLADAVGPQRAALTQPEARAVGVGMAGPHPEIPAQRPGGLDPEGDCARTAALAEHLGGLRSEVDVFDGHASALAPPNACVEQEEDQGHVPALHEAGALTSLQEALQLIIV
jgi:hypothetical protein